MKSDKIHERWLLELTGLPSASGREDRVIAWVEKWARRRKDVAIKVDRFGNRMLYRKKHASRSPVVFTAHMDHPAFVVTGAVTEAVDEAVGAAVDAAVDGRTCYADFRGGVQPEYFAGSRVVWHSADGVAHKGKVVELRSARDRDNHADASAVLRFTKKVGVAAGDVVVWDVGSPKIAKGRLHALACDDLAGLAAGLCAFDRLRATDHDVRLLLTRAEEIGFVGAIGACRSGLIPRGARLLNLENSKASDSAPIGGGPVIRVGDLMSTFTPELVDALTQAAGRLKVSDSSFKYQRRLMDGGACEATAFTAFGFCAAGLCLPLGNYHNMNEGTGKIRAESISVADYHGLVKLLVASADWLVAKGSDSAKAPTIRTRLDRIFQGRHSVLR